MRLAIGTPCGERVGADFALSLAGLAASVEATRDIILLKGTGSVSAATARNRLVEGAQAHGADWLLMADSDMTFPPYAADRLLSHDVPIVGATYRRRGGEFDILGSPMPEEWSGLRPATVIPLGLTLIRMDVFRVLKAPWFWVSIDSETRELVGEDIVFCRDVQAAGFGVWCDWELSKDVGHQCQITLTLATNPV